MKMKSNKIIFCIIILLANFLISNQITQNKNNLADDKLYRRAKALENAGLLDDAEKLYNQIFSNTPNNEKYYNALKKILLKNTDCASMMENAIIFSNAQGNTKYSKIAELEIQIICNADWEVLFNELLNNNLSDLQYLRKLIAKFINIGDEKIAIQTIAQVRTTNEDMSFFANELGYYYMSSKEYDKSVREFLNHLEKFPKHLRMINERVMSFPNDNDQMNNKIIELLQNSTIKESKVILADFYFKIEQFDQAINTLKEYKLMDQMLSLAIDLDKLMKFELSNNLFIYVIENSNRKSAEKAVFEFAKSLEKRGIVEKSNLPISGFMVNNNFFSSPFVRVNKTESDLMHRAINLYDSLSIHSTNLQSNFRLAEIQFRALEDLDSAYNIYMKIYESANNRDLKLNVITRIVDVALAKGDLEAGIKILNKELDSRLWNEDEKIKLRMKKNQILFYKSEIDFLFNDLESITKQYSVQENDYNDIIDVMRVLILFKDSPEIFKKYSHAQLKIHQNKRTEAINILDALSYECENPLMKDLINYQVANLLVYQDKIDEALNKLETISEEGIYNELSKILIAEIYDYILTDYLYAKEFYYDFLKTYPSSIYHETIRLRLKEIMENSIQ
tara:strand:- start:202 stop:2061 length:1860 start_codon:yes stop_codon:yes gene_type:complete